MREGDQDGGSSGHPDDDVEQKREEATVVLQCSAMLIMMMRITLMGGEEGEGEKRKCELQQVANAGGHHEDFEGRGAISLQLLTQVGTIKTLRGGGRFHCSF